MTVTRPQVALVVALLAAAAGAIDAAVGGVWDQLAVLTVVVVLLTFALWPRGRSSLTVRSDLARWLRTRAAIDGEPNEVLVDRMVVTYRDHLTAPSTDIDEPLGSSAERSGDGPRSAR